MDSIGVDAALELLTRQYGKSCVYVSENSSNVIFLKDANAVGSLKESSLGESIKIRTVYGKADIARGWSMGYWPDVRIIKSDPKMNYRITVGQHPETGEVEYSHDLRRTFREGCDDDNESIRRGIKELHPFVSYYPYHKEEPVAAYLVPRNLPNGTRVIVGEPIENVLKTTWNQGGGWRAKDIPAYIENKKVILDLDQVKVSHALG